MNNKKSAPNLYIHPDQADVIMRLSDAKSAKLIKAMISYFRGEDVKVSDDIEPVFILFSSQIDRDLESYKNTCSKNKANIDKRWKNKKVEANKNTIVYDRIPNNTSRYQTYQVKSNQVKSNKEINNEVPGLLTHEQKMSRII